LNPDPQRKIWRQFFQVLKINIKVKNNWSLYYFLPFLAIKMFKKLRKSIFYSSFFLPMNSDSESGFTKSLNPDLIRIRIHNLATYSTVLPVVSPLLI
jgi:hypothetical protein